MRIRDKKSWIRNTAFFSHGCLSLFSLLHRFSTPSLSLLIVVLVSFSLLVFISPLCCLSLSSLLPFSLLFAAFLSPHCCLSLSSLLPFSPRCCLSLSTLLSHCGPFLSLLLRFIVHKNFCIYKFYFSVGVQCDEPL